MARSLNCRSQTKKPGKPGHFHFSKLLPGEKSLPTPYGFKIQTDAAWSGVVALPNDFLAFRKFEGNLSVILDVRDY